MTPPSTCRFLACDAGFVTLSDDSNRQPWTGEELRLLRRHHKRGAAYVATLTGRSVWSVKAQAKRLRISLRPRGSRRGLVLGQPRGTSLRPKIRADFLSGRCDPEIVARRMRIDREAELCPACGSRPAEVRTTGFCLRCHTDRLTEGHQEALADAESVRECNRVKQRAKRARDKAGIITPLAARRRENQAAAEAQERML